MRTIERFLKKENGFKGYYEVSAKTNPGPITGVFEDAVRVSKDKNPVNNYSSDETDSSSFLGRCCPVPFFNRE